MELHLSLKYLMMDEWMTCDFMKINSISDILGGCVDDHERLCAIEPRVQFIRFGLKRGSNSGPPNQ